MRIAVIQREEYLVEKKSAHDRYRKEGDGLDNDHQRVRIRALEADDEGQDNDTDHVVNNGGADDGGAYLTLDLTQFLQRGDGDADAGRRHNRTDEDRLIEILTAPGCHAVEAHIQKCSQDERNKYTRTGDHKRHRACFDQFLQVGLQSYRKH